MTHTYTELFEDLYANYGQGDTHRTHAIARRVLGHVHADVAPRLVREFAEWVISFDATPEGSRDVTMNQIITNAQAALLLPAGYCVTAGGSGQNGQIDDPCGPDVEDAYAHTGTLPLAQFARAVVGLDDPAPSTVGAQVRRVTALRDLIARARGVLHATDAPAVR